MSVFGHNYPVGIGSGTPNPFRNLAIALDPKAGELNEVSRLSFCIESVLAEA